MIDKEKVLSNIGISDHYAGFALAGFLASEYFAQQARDLFAEFAPDGKPVDEDGFSELLESMLYGATKLSYALGVQMCKRKKEAIDRCSDAEETAE